MDNKDDFAANDAQLDALANELYDRIIEVTPNPDDIMCIALALFLVAASDVGLTKEELVEMVGQTKFQEEAFFDEETSEENDPDLN